MRLRTVVGLLIVAVVAFAFLYWFREVEPIKTHVGPYITQAVDFVKAQLTHVKDMLGEYAVAAGGIITTAVAGIGAVIRNYFNKQKQTVIDAANSQITSAETEITRLLGLNKKLEAENETLKARLEQLQDVEGNMAKMQTELDKTVKRLDEVTAERNQVQRDLQLIANPPKEPVRAE